MCFNRENSFCCCAISILSALLAATGIAAVFFAGLISAIIALIIITLIFGIVGIFLIFIPLVYSRTCSCNYIDKTCLITTSVGSIISSSFALSLTSLVPGVLTSSILIGVVAFFLILQLINLINLLIAIISRNN